MRGDIQTVQDKKVTIPRRTQRLVTRANAEEALMEMRCSQWYQQIWCFNDLMEEAWNHEDPKLSSCWVSEQEEADSDVKDWAGT